MATVRCSIQPQAPFPLAHLPCEVLPPYKTLLAPCIFNYVSCFFWGGGGGGGRGIVRIFLLKLRFREPTEGYPLTINNVFWWVNIQSMKGERLA